MKTTVKNKFYKISFWMLVIVLIISINAWHISSSIAEKNNNYSNTILEKRLDKLLEVNTILDRKIGVVYGKEIVSKNEELIISSDSTYLVVLVSDFDCAKCQENELLMVNNLIPFFKNKGINVICITTQDKLHSLVVQKEALSLSMDMYIIDENIFKNDLSIDSKFPQVLLINEGIITVAFMPIAKDAEYSKLFYNKITQRIDEIY
ncbi:MAG: hypothetical protein K9H06_20340 [Melioribacteraceae bacterium]|nr:hypothetical protein [Melioribacteraceae bacterium]MCF8420969.1 hypothetical protein [Melioribacteraceae bacterium]